MANNDGLSQNIELNVSVNQDSISKAQRDIKNISMAREIEINVKGIKTAGGRVDAGKAIADAMGVDVNALLVGKFKKLSAEIEAKLNKQESDVKIDDLDFSDFKTPVSLFAKKYNDLVDSINESTKSLANVSGLKVAEQDAFGIDESIFDKANSRNKKVAASAARELNYYLDILEKIAKGQNLNNRELLKIADFEYSRDSKILQKGYTKKSGERVPEVRGDQVTVSPGLASAVANKLLGAVGEQLVFSKPFKASGGFYESISNRDTGTDRPIVQTLPNKGIYKGSEVYQASPEEAKKFKKEMLDRARNGQFKELQEALLDRVIQDFDDITEALLESGKQRLLSFKNIKDLIAKDPTWTADGLSSQDAMQGTLRYVVEHMQELLPELERKRGYEPGTYLAHGRNLKSGAYGTTFDQLPDTGSDVIEPGFINKVLSESFGEISGEIVNALPDAIRENIAEPIEQMFKNPGILGKGFATTPAQQIGKFIGKGKTTRTLEEMVVDPSAAMPTSFIGGGSTFKESAAYELNFVLDLIEANKRNLEITTSSADKEARSKKIADLTKELELLEAKHGMTAEEAKLRSVGVSAVRAEDQRLNAEEQTRALDAVKAKTEQLEALKASAYDSELERIKTVGVEALKAAEAKLAAEKKAAEPKAEKRVGIIPMPIPESNKRPPAQLDVAAKAAAAVMPQLDKYRPVIGDAIVDSIVKLIGEASGDVSKVTAAFDTEFIYDNLKPIYEAGVTIKTALGQFEDIFKLVNIPVGSESEINKALKRGETKDKPASGAGSLATIKERGAAMGIAPADMGTGAGDAEDMAQYRQKLIQLGTVLQALDEVGIQLAGSNIASADFGNLAKAMHRVNEFFAETEAIDQVKAPIVDNVVDFTRITQQLVAMSKAGTISKELLPVIQGELKDGVVKGANGLGALLAKAIDMQPELAKQYGVQKQDNGFSIDGMPAHMAIADNRAALIVLDFLKQFAQTATLISNGTSNLSETYGNGVAGPYSNKIRADNSTAFGGGFAVDPAERAAAANVLVLETNAQDENNKVVRTGVELAQKQLADRKDYKEVLDQINDAQRVSAAIARISTDGVISSEDKALIEAYLPKLEKLNEEYAQLTEAEKKKQQLTGAGGNVGREAGTAAASLRALLDSPSNKSAFNAARDVKAVSELKGIEATEKAYEAEATVKEIADKRKAQSGKNYANTATQVQREVTGATLDYIQKTESEYASHSRNEQTILQTRIVGIEQEEKARKDASETIKRIYKDQVEAEKAVEKATKDSINSWVTGRYALYDVGNAYQNVSTQLFRVARQIFDITKSYRDYETAFTSVERAMQLDFGKNINSSDPTLRRIAQANAAGAKELKDQFIALSEVIPVAFEELSRIATLGAQMGIGAKGIVQFTETVAQFAAVTGISADTVAQKFGKIAELTNLDSADFDKLGSAVAFAGVNAVATESEILTLSESIAAVSSQVGMTTPDVIGLATSLSSVGIPAEQARGVFTRVFADIDRAVSAGGSSLANFAGVAGMSVKDFSAAWGEQGESYGVFRAMLGGLNATSDLTKAFDKLGITETREINTLTRLAKNLNVVDQAAIDAGASFGDGQFLLDSFSKTTDNLDSQITIFKNNLKSLGEQIGQNFGGSLKDALVIGSELAKFLKEMAKSPIMQLLTGASFGITAIAGVMTGFTAIMTKVIAQIYAFRVAMINSANDPTAMSSITRQIKQLTNFRSGLIEMRSELQTPNAGVRGELAPVDYGTFGSMEKQLQKKLELDNLYIASGDNVLKSLDDRKKAEMGLGNISSLKKADDAQRVLLARTEADQINKLVQERRNEVENLRQLTDTTTAAGRAKVAEAASSKILYRWVNGEAVAYTAAQVARAQGIVSGKIMANTKQKEAATHLLNSKAIDLETQSASKASAGVVGLGSKALGVLGGIGIALSVVTAIASIVQGISTAVKEANKLDLSESGLTIEALRETLTADTQAWRENGQAIAVQRSQYETTTAETNKYAQAISGLDSTFAKAYSSQKTLTDGTREQTVAFGNSTKQLIADSILANAKIRSLIDRNQNMFTDMASMGFNASELIDAVMSGTEKADEYLDSLDEEIAKLEEILALRQAGSQEGWKTNPLGTGDIWNEKTGQIDMTGWVDNSSAAIQGRIDELKATSQAARDALKKIDEAIAMSKISDILAGYTGGFIGLESRMKSVIKTGKGMAAFLKQIRSASVEFINNIGEENFSKEYKLKFDSAGSVKEMLNIAEAAKKAAIAIVLLQAKAANAGPTAIGAAIANINALYAPLLKNLNLLNSSANDLKNQLADGAETAADKLKRLISEANSSVKSLSALNSALRAVGEAFRASKDWSPNTEGGAAKFDAILAVIDQIGENAGANFPKAIRELQAFQLTLKETGASASAVKLVSNAIEKLGGDSTLTAKQVTALKKAFPNLFTNMLNQINAVTAATKTLGDYVSDIKSVMADAFGRRYGKQTSLDEISNAWQAIKDSAKSAQEAMDDANKTMMGLNADKNLIEYQLKIAVKYNDLERQKYLTNKLAETNASLAEQSSKIVEANALKDKSLKGDSKTVIDNRNQVRGLVQTYTNYLATLAASGMSSTDLKAKAGTLAEEFLTQGQNLGFAKSELKEYTDAFLGDFTKVIDGVPNEVTLKVNTDPALAAIEEFVKKANISLAKVDIVGNNGTGSEKPSADEISAYKSDKVSSTLFALTSWQRAAAADKVKAFEDKYGKVYAANGGYIAGPGTATSDSVPAMLSNGEYVIKASSVKSLGTDFLDEVNARGSRFANGGFMNTAGYNAGHAKPKGILDKVQDFFKTKINTSALANPLASPIFKKIFDAKESKQNKAVSSTLKTVTGLLSGNPLMHGLAYDSVTSMYDSIINLGANKGSIGDLANTLIAAIPGGKQASGITGAGLKAVGKTLSATRRSFPAEGLASNPNGKVKLIDPALREQKDGSQVFGPGTYFAKNLDASFNSWGPSYGTQLEKMFMGPAAMLKMARSKGYIDLEQFKGLAGYSKGTLGHVKISDPLVQQLLKQGYVGLESKNAKLLTSWVLGAQKGLGLKKFGDLHPGTNAWLNPNSIQQIQNKMRLEMLKKDGLAGLMSPNKMTEKMISDTLKNMGNLLKGSKGKTVPNRPSIEGSTGGLVTPKAIIPKYFADGGYAKGTDTIPAMLTPGEFIMSSGAVSKYGVDFLNALNQQRASFSPVQPQAQAQQSQGSQMVYLSPEDRQLLRAAIDRPVALYTENTKIAASANAGNLLLAQRGSN